MSHFVDVSKNGSFSFDSTELLGYITERPQSKGKMQLNPINKRFLINIKPRVMDAARKSLSFIARARPDKRSRQLIQIVTEGFAAHTRLLQHKYMFGAHSVNRRRANDFGAARLVDHRPAVMEAFLHRIIAAIAEGDPFGTG